MASRVFAMELLWAKSTASCVRGLQPPVIPASRHTPWHTVSALVHMSRRTRTRPRRVRCVPAWCWPSSRGFIGKVAAVCAWRTIFLSLRAAAKSYAPIPTTFACEAAMATSSARGKTDTMNDDLAQAILSQIREDELVAMCSDVVNIPSPTGEELGMGRYMRRVLEEAGLSVSWQEVEEGRANVVGLWEGTGNGKSLMFNGHMDTSNTGREEFLTGIGYKARAVIKNGFIYGLGIYNMKGALVCYTHAVKALKRTGVKLEGDLLIAAVVGEIEKTQWSDEF